MTVYPNKFQSMIISSKKDVSNSALNKNRSSHQRRSVKRCSQKFRKIHSCFPVNFVKFLRTLFYRTLLSDCFCKNGVELTMESSVKLLGIETDNKLNCEKHISNISKKASNQLNRIFRLQTFLDIKKKEAVINTFMHSNFNYGCLIWHCSSIKSQNKVKKTHKRSSNKYFHAFKF